MKYSAEICNFLGKEESEIKTLGPKAVEQIELAWVRERPDIVHNLAYPLFKDQNVGPVEVVIYKHRDDAKDVFSTGEPLYRVEPLTKQELKQLQKWAGSRLRAAEKWALTGSKHAEDHLPLLTSLQSKLDVM